MVAKRACMRRAMATGTSVEANMPFSRSTFGKTQPMLSMPAEDGVGEEGVGAIVMGMAVWPGRRGMAAIWYEGNGGLDLAGGEGLRSVPPLMSKLRAVRPTRNWSKTGGKFSEKAWERAARTWIRQKMICE